MQDTGIVRIIKVFSSPNNPIPRPKLLQPYMHNITENYIANSNDKMQDIMVLQ